MKKNKNINLSILLTGLFLIGAGILQLLFVTGHIPMEYKSIIFSWEMLLVASGIICLFSRFRFCSIMGIILMAAGAIFLINQNALNIPAFDYLSHNIWPLLLIFLGLLIIIRSFFMKNYYVKKILKKHIEEHIEKSFKQVNSITKDVLEGFKNNEPGYVYHNYIFGGGKEKLEAIEFKGGDINCIFGGLALDLRDTKLAEGINILTINTVMGGVVIYMPIDWNIILKKNNIFGSFEDHRPKSTFKPDNNRILIIESSAVFGGGEIRWNDKSSNI